MLIKPEFFDAPVHELRKNTWNTNQVTPDNEIKIRASLERNGMFKPILVREVEGVPGLEIIGGEHRWEQAIELGYKTVPVCNLGLIDDIKAKEIGLIDNARYGADDTLSLGELLKELGTSDEIQEYLPYGDADLTAIFSASDIALDDLDLHDESEDSDEAPAEPPAARAPKTHTIMRFKVPLKDAERLSALIARTQKNQGLTAGDELTNAGDALVHLLVDQFAKIEEAEAVELDELTSLLDEATKDA
jgi:hypothetical protein